MKNPFVYGKEVTKENFCNRPDEIKELTRDIENSQSVLIYSQRRFGKTSLIKRVYEQLSPDVVRVYADLYPVLSDEDFISIYAEAVSRVVTGGVTEKIKELASVFTKIRPVFSMDQSGRPTFSVEVKASEVKLYLEDVLESVFRYTEKVNKRAVVCFDAFQQIGQLKTDRLEKYMRSKFQAHKNVSYIFMGSKKHLIHDMFNNPNRPFYRSAKPFPLGKINEAELKHFIGRKFADSGKSISGELIDKIISVCESHPYYVQYLCHIIWEQAIDRGSITGQDFEDSLGLLLQRESSTYEATWDLLSVKQRQVLIALSEMSSGEKIFSADFLHENKLGSASSVQRTLNSLIDKDLVDKTGGRYSVIDMFLKKWIIAHSA